MDITFKCNNPKRDFPRGKIAAIKAFREVTTYGLKEAKEVIDGIEQHGEYTVSDLRMITPSQVRFLRVHGVVIHTTPVPLRVRTRQLLIAAIKNDDIVLAKGLFQAFCDSFE